MARRSPSANNPSAIPDVPPLLTLKQWVEVIRALRLTPQQAKVVGLILRGKRDKQIAAETGLSIWTVRTHLRHIFARLDVKDRVELVLRAFAAALAPLPSQK